jgi:hypothetical protein
LGAQVIGIKLGANENTGGREVWFAIGVVSTVLAKHGYQSIVTSLNDGKHMEGSLHYKNRAVDLRFKHIPAEKRDELSDEINALLNPLGFDWVVEADHWHCEFDPKNGEKFTEETI